MVVAEVILQQSLPAEEHPCLTLRVLQDLPRLDLQGPLKDHLDFGAGQVDDREQRHGGGGHDPGNDPDKPPFVPCVTWIMPVLLQFDQARQCLFSRVEGAVPRETFDTYLAVVKAEGGRWNEAERGHLIPLDRAAGLLHALNLRRMDLRLTPEVRRLMLADNKRIEDERVHAQKRIDESDARLGGQGYLLSPEQKEGILWLAPRRRAMVRDKVGVGKTAEALLALEPDVGCVVITTTTMLGTWLKEAALWRPDFVARLGQPLNWQWPPAGEIHVFAVDGLPEQLQPLEHEVVLVVDEAHKLKNSKTKRVKRFTPIRDAVMESEGRVWLMTATPLINEPVELWNTLKCAGLHEEAFGSWPRFCEHFSAVQGRFGIIWGTPSHQMKLCLDRVSICRSNGLGPVRRQVITVKDVKAQTFKSCQQTLQECRRVGLPLEDLADDTDLLSRIPGPVFELLSRARSALATVKLPSALELIEDLEEAEEPLVVFSSFRGPIESIAQRPGWAGIHGGVPALQRTELVDLFQSGKLRGLAIVTEVGGSGITLTRAANCLFIDLPWNPALVVQAEGRLNRKGQTRRVVSRRLVAGHPLDVRMAEIIDRKAEIISKME
jgi:SWI/SNF-related matrix-associated actin-dependent regulator 1 of chromatin subfamily A